MDIFLSRPNWVSETYSVGLEIFLSKIGDLGLNPRTIGKTDFPVKSPLDEVIRVMGECRGAVILGYPQIEMVTGSVKGMPLTNPLCLPTEWNHIEAGLAYAKNLPLLVIHHIGIERGIFDRGALNGFIFNKDFSNPSWSADEQITGALRAWRDSVIQGTVDMRSLSNKKAQHIEEKKDVVWTAFGSGRKVNDSKPLGAGYRESAAVRIEEVNEYYVVIQLLSNSQRVTVPLADLELSYDQKHHRPAMDVRAGA